MFMITTEIIKDSIVGKCWNFGWAEGNNAQYSVKLSTLQEATVYDKITEGLLLTLPNLVAKKRKT